MQRDFLRFTSQMIIKDLRNNHPEILQEYFVGAKDRNHQVWERNALSVPLWTEDVVRQKLNYIHNNPVRAGLCLHPEEYKYSSAPEYYGLPCEWDFITLIG